MEYLGDLVSAEGISPLPVKLTANREMPWPPEFPGASLLQVLHQGSRLNPQAPHTDVTKGKEGKAAKLGWSQDMAAAFEKAKEVLASAALLAHPVQEAEISVVMDASTHQVGAVMQQLVAAWPRVAAPGFLQPKAVCHSEPVLCF